MALSYDIAQITGEFANRIYTDNRSVTYELEEVPMTASMLVGSKSRYAAAKLVLYRSGNTTFYVPKPLVINVSRTGTFKYFEVTARTQYRPDRIAHLAYGDSTLWWAVMAANDLMDFEQVVAGMTLRLPQIT